MIDSCDNFFEEKNQGDKKIENNRLLLLSLSILGGPKITVFRFSLFISLSMYLNQTHWPYDMLQNQISCP